MTHLVFTDEWLREYEKRTGLGERGKTNQTAAPADQKPKKRSKYGNRRTEYAGRVFDSAHEAEAFRQLDFRVRAGELRGVVCQQAFRLPGGVKYVADFVVLKNDGTYDVVDAKSEATRKDKAYRLKRRQMKEVLGIEIVEVRAMGEWYECEPEDDPLQEGTSTDQSVFLAAFALVCVLAGAAICKIGMWLF